MPATAVRGQKLANELARMADRLEGKFRQAFLRSMLTVADDPELKKLIKEIGAGRFVFGDPIDSRLESVRINLAEMNEVARQAIAGSAKVTKDVLNLKGSFDVVNDSVLQAARNLSVDLSTYLRKSTKESLRQVIEDLISGNISEAEAIRRIKLEVGLLPQHTKAVNNYRKTLINAGTPRGKANQLAEQYTKRLLKYRANMISRTEVARATGIGQTEFWRQMRDQGALPAQANRVWITALDERACDFCRSMNGQVATIDGGWDTPNGYMEYPQASHPHCRCSSGIVMSKPTKTGQMGRVAKVDEVEWDRWVAKHLGGQHDQSRHARGNVIDRAVSSAGSSKAPTKSPKKTKSDAVANKKGLRLGVDYDADGYPLDTDGGVVGSKLTDIHGVYDDATSAALAIAKRGPKNLLMPRDKNGLPQVLKLADAEKRYGTTPNEVIETLRKKFGVAVEANGVYTHNLDRTMDTLHGVAQGIEEAIMNGIPVKEMASVIRVDMAGRQGDVYGYWRYSDRSITLNGYNIPSGETVRNYPVQPAGRYHGVATPFESLGYKYGEGGVRASYGVFVHELGHAMDNYVGRKIQETRKRIIDETFAGTDLIRSDWANTARGRAIIYDNRDVNATTYYSDTGASGLVRPSALEADAPSIRGSIGSSVSVSDYATYNLRENFAETFTAYWLYGGSKGQYKNYYNQYIGRVGNIIDMSQGIIKVDYQYDDAVIVTDISLLPPSHPLIVWLTGIIPIA